jgi:hypothetical protein
MDKFKKNYAEIMAKEFIEKKLTEKESNECIVRLLIDSEYQDFVEGINAIARDARKIPLLNPDAESIQYYFVQALENICNTPYNGKTIEVVIEQIRLKNMLENFG